MRCCQSKIGVTKPVQFGAVTNAEDRSRIAERTATLREREQLIGRCSDATEDVGIDGFAREAGCMKRELRAAPNGHALSLPRERLSASSPH